MSIRLKISAFILFFVMALTVMDHHNLAEAKENKQYDADQLKEMVAEFFSVKCGIPKKVLRKSKYEVMKEGFRSQFRPRRRLCVCRECVRLRLSAEVERSQPGGLRLRGPVFGRLSFFHAVPFGGCAPFLS